MVVDAVGARVKNGKKDANPTCPVDKWVRLGWVASSNRSTSCVFPELILI
jgi:hypothetical protein